MRGALEPCALTAGEPGRPLRTPQAARLRRRERVRPPHASSACPHALQDQKVDSASADANWEALSKYGTDLTANAARLDPVIGRDDEIRRVVRILSRRTKNNPVLVGEPGAQQGAWGV